MAKKLTRSEQLVRASKIRAAIIACVNDSNSASGLTLADIENTIVDIMLETGFETKGLSNMLPRMVEGNLIASTKIEGRYHYFTKKRPFKKKENETVLAEDEWDNLVYLDSDDDGIHRKKDLAKLKKSDKSIANVKVDVVKSTGHVHITVQGITIDIGVI
jgi:hypothetical protein